MRKIVIRHKSLKKAFNCCGFFFLFTFLGLNSFFGCLFQLFLLVYAFLQLGEITVCFVLHNSYLFISRGFEARRFVLYKGIKSRKPVFKALFCNLIFTVFKLCCLIIFRFDLLLTCSRFGLYLLYFILELFPSDFRVPPWSFLLPDV